MRVSATPNYIARNASVPLHNGSKLASYLSPVGRLASLKVGDEVIVQIAGRAKQFELLENIKYQPRRTDGVWDSWNTVLEGEDYGPLTVESLQALLKGAFEEEDVEALWMHFSKALRQTTCWRGCAMKCGAPWLCATSRSWTDFRIGTHQQDCSACSAA